MVQTRSQKRALEKLESNGADADCKPDVIAMAPSRSLKRSTSDATEDRQVVQQRKKRRAVVQNQVDRLTSLAVDVLVCMEGNVCFLFI